MDNAFSESTATRAVHDPDARIAIRPVESADYAWLRASELSLAMTGRWRLGGGHPRPEHYAESLWLGVHSHYVAFDLSRSSGCLGLLSIYDVDWQNGVGYFAAARFDNSWNGRLGFLFAFQMALGVTFQTTNLRKLYMDTPSYNHDLIRSFVRKGLFTEEGRLIERRYLNGQYFDQYILSVTPAQLASLDMIGRAT